MGLALSQTTVESLSIDALVRSSVQPRTEFPPAEMDELAASIRENGILQPIIVRPIMGQNKFEIVAGERRWRAARMISLRRIPAIVRSLSDDQALEVAIIENVQRENLSAIDEARSYRKLQERFGYTQEKIARAVGKSRPHIANTLRLLKLPPVVQARLQDRTLTAGAARQLINRSDAVELAAKITDRGLNNRDAEAMVRPGRTHHSSGINYKLSSGRTLSAMRWHELARTVAALEADLAVLGAIRRHLSSVPDEFMTISELIPEQTLERIVANHVK